MRQLLSPVIVRAARPDDYSLFVRLFAELGTGDAALTEDKWQVRILPSMFVAECDAPAGTQACGYIYVQVLQSSGYIRNLVVSPDFRGGGVGRMLLNHVAAYLRSTPGVVAWELNVKPDNAAALALYSSVGMHIVGEGVAIRLSWDSIDTMQDHDPPLTLEGRQFDASEDASLERQFGLIGGQIEDSRRRGFRTLLLCQANGVRGVACFDPSFPGCFPFRLASSLDARQMLTCTNSVWFSRRIVKAIHHVATIFSAFIQMSENMRHHHHTSPKCHGCKSLWRMIWLWRPFWRVLVEPTCACARYTCEVLL